MDTIQTKIAVWAYKRGLKEGIDTLVERMTNLPDASLEEQFSKIILTTTPPKDDLPKT